MNDADVIENYARRIFADENACACVSPFEPRDIISQQQEIINRQKAEIDFVISSRKLAEAAANTLKTELEVSKAFHREAVCERDLLSIQLKIAKAEAIKEFAERLKDIYATHDGLRMTIDNLVKEMVGEVK